MKIKSLLLLCSISCTSLLMAADCQPAKTVTEKKTEKDADPASALERMYRARYERYLGCTFLYPPLYDLIEPGDSLYRALLPSAEDYEAVIREAVERTERLIAMGHILYDEAAAKECVGLVGSATCKEILTEDGEGFPEACLRAILPNQDAGDECADKEVCKDGLYCTATEITCGECTAQVAADASCDNDEECVDDLECFYVDAQAEMNSALRVVVLEIPARTQEDSAARIVLFCIDDMCSEPLGVGEDCVSGDEFCAEELSCIGVTGSATCQEAEVALVCEVDAEDPCGDQGYTLLVCVPDAVGSLTGGCTMITVAEIGDGCDELAKLCVHQFTTTYCLNEICMERPEIGEPCGPCTLDAYCNDDLVCTARKPEGSACDLSECELGTNCEDGICEANGFGFEESVDVCE